MLKIALADKICRRLMSTPGVGALVALTYRSTVDDPSRFGKSSTVGAYFGLTPRKYQSGEADEADRDGGVEERIRPLFTQERVAASAARFLDVLFGDELRKTG
jgi:transposase